MSRIHISNNLGRVGNTKRVSLAGYKPSQRIYRHSHLKPSRSVSRMKKDIGIVRQRKTSNGYCEKV